MLYSTKKGMDDGGAKTLPSIVGTVCIGASLVTLWSEISVALTGCGPAALSESIERAGYVLVLIPAGLSIFTRIVWRCSATDYVFAEKVAIAEVGERATLACVVGAYLALFAQILHGQQVNPESLTGIDELYCSAFLETGAPLLTGIRPFAAFGSI